MRDNRFTNFWGETPEEEEKHRQYMYNEYDRIAAKSQGQTPYQSGQNNFGQAAPQPDASQQKSPWQKVAGVLADQAFNNAAMFGGNGQSAQSQGMNAAINGIAGLAKNFLNPAQDGGEQTAFQPAGGMNSNSFSAPQPDASQQKSPWQKAAGVLADQAFSNASMFGGNGQSAQRQGMNAAINGIAGLAKNFLNPAQNGGEQPFNNLEDYWKRRRF